MEKLRQQFLEPADEFSPVPFWFWNDRLTKEEIVRQIHEFRDKGVMGFVIHPRMGIPREIPYLSDAYLDLVETAVTCADQLGMIVILYDEAMYPSGSANGLVVKENPRFASRGLRMLEYRCAGETVLSVQLKDDEFLISAQAVEKTADRAIRRDSATLLDPHEGAVRFTPTEGGDWSILLFIETYSKGTIRGIHEGEDDGAPGAPPSADLLNPEAVRAFIRLTHDRYYERLGRYFGSTIRAIFTDEPHITGRWAMKGIKSWTGHFLADYVSEGNKETDLPALWFEAGAETANVRQRYRKAINKRLTSAYYRPLYDWCEEHGIALTGHPSGSDEIGLLEHFHIPGQDVVWRWIAPEGGLGLTGAHSTMGKCSSDAARHRGRRRNLNECFGVCGLNKGWDLTAGDMKWFMDWLFVRGVNLLVPHAFYYSIEGDLRRNERPPDVGPNNIWWPHYRMFSQYIKRMSWLMTDAVNVARVAVLCAEERLPWRIVKPLFERQIEFNYLEESLLESFCSVSGGQLRIARQCYEAVLVEDPAELAETAREWLRRYLSEGGKVIVCDPGSAPGWSGLEGILAISGMDDVVSAVDGVVPRDPVFEPSCSDLRVSHVVKEGVHFYLVVNEGEQRYEGRMSCGKVVGAAEVWRPWEGTAVTLPIAQAGEAMYLPVRLNRRESVIYAIDPTQSPTAQSPTAEAQDASPSAKQQIHIADWRISQSSIPFVLPDRLDSWTLTAGMEHYSGTVVYEGIFELNSPGLPAYAVLDLGEVHEIAEVRINGREAGVAMWAPYTFDILHTLQHGTNRITVAVTNSLANRYDRAAQPSGLLGPVRIETYENRTG